MIKNNYDLNQQNKGRASSSSWSLLVTMVTRVTRVTLPVYLYIPKVYLPWVTSSPPWIIKSCSNLPRATLQRVTLFQVLISTHVKFTQGKLILALSNHNLAQVTLTRLIFSWVIVWVVLRWVNSVCPALQIYPTSQYFTHPVSAVCVTFSICDWLHCAQV